MSKHTPGPWVIHHPKPGDYDPKHLAIIAPHDLNTDTVLVCEMNYTTRNPWKPPADGEADAKLIAAAPELLEAMIDLVNYVNELASENVIGDEDATEVNKVASKLIGRLYG